MKNRLVAILLTLMLLVSLVPMAVATDMYSVDTEMADICAIARNTPMRYLPTADWTNVAIIKITSLHDLEGNVTAYCVDLQNADTGENTYVFVNADPRAYPILQYSPDSKSPYYDDVEGRAVFLSVGQYLVESEGMITELNTNNTIPKDTLLMQYQAEMEASAINAEEESAEAIDYSDLRASYIAGIAPMAYDTKEKILTKVPNWHWRKGCAPTAVAMQIANLLPSVPSSGDAMIDKLAEYMETDLSSGASDFADITHGAQNYIGDCNFSVTTLAGWQSATWAGAPYVGSDSNPYTAYVSEIDNGRAVSIYVENATGEIGGKEYEWKGHMITGVGYSYSTVNSQEKQVIVYTTNQSDGRVYLPFYGTSLGNFAWFKIVQ